MGTFPNVSSNMFLIAVWGDVAASPPVGESKEGTINTSMVEGAQLEKEWNQNYKRWKHFKYINL